MVGAEVVVGGKVVAPVGTPVGSEVDGIFEGSFDEVGSDVRVGDIVLVG